MPKINTFNVLMYSHDTYGLGHIRRTMAIAAQIAGPTTNVLILTGSPIAGRFTAMEQVDFIRIPGMIKKTNEEYLPLSIKIDPSHALEIRKSIIAAATKSFQPHLLIVDKEPLGLKKELLPTLRWLRRHRPQTQTILGLRDVMDDARTVRRDWKNKRIYQALNQYYNEIWVYGDAQLYDPVREYAIPAAVAGKTHFVGYIPRKVPHRSAVRHLLRDQGLVDGETLVLVTAGGGGDGYTVMATYLEAVERLQAQSPSGRVSFKSVLITGPFMPGPQRQKIVDRARRMGMRTYDFFPQMETMIAAADVVVSMGGYNTICEIISQQRVALVVPRQTPRKEQLIRTRALAGRQLLDHIPLDKLNAEQMLKKLAALLENPRPYQDAMARFRLTGIDRICQRIEAIKGQWLC